MREILKRIYYRLRRLTIRPRVHSTGRVSLDPTTQYNGGTICVGRNSTLIVEEGVRLQADITIGEDCRVHIGRGCSLRNANLDVRRASTVEFRPESLLGCRGGACTRVDLDQGTLVLGERSLLLGQVLVRFGGRLSIGRWTATNHGTEIRCEDEITIGDYGLISYDVCIYDTNTHSTDWNERRERIEQGYPDGAGEVRKPRTKPIRIGDDVWIGKGATLTKGTRIGNRCTVGIRTSVGGGVYDDDCLLVSPPPRVIRR